MTGISRAIIAIGEYQRIEGDAALMMPGPAVAGSALTPRERPLKTSGLGNIRQWL